MGLPSKKTFVGRAAAIAFASLIVHSGDAVAVVTVDFTLSPPGVQESPLQNEVGSLTENFNTLSSGSLPASGSFAVGNYSFANSISIINADAFGGAGGTGRYIGSSASGGGLSLALASPSKYIGFWWSAGSVNNIVEVYGAGNTLLASFNSSQITSLLGPFGGPYNTVLATDNNSYSGAAYYGNPNPGPSFVNPFNEPYAYVNLRLSDPSISFTRIDFSGPNFEFDNLTISPNYYNPTASVPGPLPVLGGAAAFGWSRRLRQRLQASR